MKKYRQWNVTVCFIENNEILMREHEEKQYTRIKKYNTECDIKNFDLLYTEIALRNEY